MFSVLNYLCIAAVKPTGTVDLIIITAQGFISVTSLITDSTLDVLK